MKRPFKNENKTFLKLQDHTKGVLCIIGAAFGFSMMSACVRLAGPGVPSVQKAFFRNFIALLFVSGIMIRKRISLKPEHGNIGYLFGRAFCGTVGLLCNFYAIDHLLLADANMLNKLSPFFAILLSVFILREKPNLVQILGVTVALTGSVFIVKPGFQNTDISAALLGLLGGAGAGAAYTFVRKLGLRGENSTRIIFFFSAFSCLVCLPYIAFHFTPMTLRETLFLVLSGVGACIGQFGITKAYLFAPAKEISVYDYTQVLFAALLGFLLFGQTPDIFSVVGYLLICGAGIFMFFYNKQNPQKA